ncbi:hypothetical protein [Actinomadura violacea]|uniref:SRPBCC family protein n=1 Tax=Actinomadura violacea TaxID=2819934 RepID=A0ABS3SAX4_9ACTN|nr:hypothetical protein [Actinomadura violacea]MBO2466155.1 hypothetical protein [Actinomadura violacea]
MGRYRRDVEVAPFPRELLDQVVGALLDAVEEAPITESGFEFGDEIIDGVRLVEGRHLAAGARYRGEEDGLTIDVHVPAWDRDGGSRIEVTGVSGGHTVNLRLDLRMSGRRLHSVRITGDYQGPKPFRGLRRVRWEGHLRAEEWWSAPGAKTPPLSLRVVHRFAIAEVRIARGKGKRGRWSVRTTTRLGGRSLLRPLAAVWLAANRARILRKLDEGLAQAATAWNAEVPRMAKRGLQERLEFEHRISLKAVPREWAETYVAELHQGTEGLVFDKRHLFKSPESTYDVRLLKGKHIRPGTRYRITFAPPSSTSKDKRKPLDLHVTAWELDGPNRIEFARPDDAQAGWVEIDSARRPTLVRAGFTDTSTSGIPVMAAAEADLQRWWSTGSLLTGTVEIPVGGATLAVERVADEDGQWTVAITAAVEGRAWARHLVAVAGVLSGPALKQAFRETADTFAERWNSTVPGAGTADQAADATLSAILEH